MSRRGVLLNKVSEASEKIHIERLLYMGSVQGLGMHSTQWNRIPFLVLLSTAYGEVGETADRLSLCSVLTV